MSFSSCRQFGLQKRLVDSAEVDTQTASTFSLNITEQDNGTTAGIFVDSDFRFVVHSC